MKTIPGNIYWLKTKSKYLHPFVVISVIEGNLKLCGITTNTKLSNMPGNIILDINEGNLEKKSIVDVSNVIKVNDSDLGGFIGTLSQDRVSQIINGIAFIERSFQRS